VALARSTEKSRSWGKFGSGGGLSVVKPFDQQPAHFGNGVMVSLEAGSKERVHRLHELALAGGGSDEGAPGPRGTTFYGAYFRDPEGNKLCVYVLLDASQSPG
jgi:predicted lactoylglutathione lyase